MGCGFFSGASSAHTTAVHASAQRTPRWRDSSACTLARLVVVAIAWQAPALRASPSSRSTPRRSPIAPRATRAA
jgi:hypothetical protein